MPDFLSATTNAISNSLFAAAVLGFVAFILRNAILRWIEGALQEKTESRIAKLEAELQEQRSLTADFRQFAISGRLSRNDALISKQIDAASAIWDALISDKRHSLLIGFMQSLKIDSIEKYLRDPDVNEFISAISKVSGFDAFYEEINQANKEKEDAISKSALSQRPFISPLAWALYHAHNMITMHAIVTIVMWKNGVDTSLLKNEELKETTARALPNQQGFIERFGVGGVYYLLDELEQKLLEELRRFLKEGETSTELVSQANEILEHSEKIRAKKEFSN